MRLAPDDPALGTVDPEEERFSARRTAPRASGRVKAAAESLSRDRRQFSRRRERELEWVRTVRLRSAGEVALIDLSAGGALIDAAVPLRPGALLSLEIIGRGLEAVVPLHVIRSHISALMPEGARYRGAVSFARPIELPGIHPPADLPLPSGDPFVGLDTALKRLVERAYASGESERLAPGDVILVLQSLARRAGGVDDPLGGVVGNLLQNVLPLLRHGRGLQEVLAAIERQLTQSVPHVRLRLPHATPAPRDVTSVLIAPPWGGASGRIALDLPSGASLDPHQARLLRTTGRVLVLVQRLHDAAAAHARATAAAVADTARVVSAASGPVPGRVVGTWQKIVARYTDGQLLKGYTPDFHGSKSQFSVWPARESASHEQVVVPLARLKAVFFVREFGGDPDYIEQKVFESAGHGRRIEVTLLDGEVLVGTTLNYGAGGTGFFIVPADPRANNQRVFVVASAIRQVRFP